MYAIIQPLYSYILAHRHRLLGVRRGNMGGIVSDTELLVAGAGRFGLHWVSILAKKNLPNSDTSDRCGPHWTLARFNLA